MAGSQNDSCMEACVECMKACRTTAEHCRDIPDKAQCTELPRLRKPLSDLLLGFA